MERMSQLISWVMNTFEDQFRNSDYRDIVYENWAYAEYANGIYRDILEMILDGKTLDEAFNEVEDTIKGRFIEAMDTATGD